MAAAPPAELSAAPAEADALAFLAPPDAADSTGVCYTLCQFFARRWTSTGPVCRFKVDLLEPRRWTVTVLWSRPARAVFLWV